MLVYAFEIGGTPFKKKILAHPKGFFIFAGIAVLLFMIMNLVFYLVLRR